MTSGSLPRLSIDLQIADRRWQKMRGLKPRLVKAAQVTLLHLPARYQVAASVSVLCADDKTVRQLNRDFRGIAKPTNVLSFPQLTKAQIDRLKPSRQPVFIGDIALGYQYMVAEAKHDHKMLLNHATHLMIHGILHLFGYNHEADRDAARMERLEKNIMHEMGLPDPYDCETPEPVVKKRAKKVLSLSQTLKTKKR